MSGTPQRMNPRGGGGSSPIFYQIDFTAVAAGKRVPTSKRRVRWRFGFANTEALRAGQTGTACRGEEHDITLVWSLTSGKRLILADGQEVHFSNSRSNVFDFSWTMKGNHVLKVVAYASAPLSPTPGFRQYDFFVNGQSFFGFPKVFRLGLAPNDPRGHASPISPTMMAESSRRSGGRTAGPGGVGGPRQSANTIASLEAPGNPDEEEAYLQEAIRLSLKDDVKPKAAPAPAPPADLLDFGDSPNTAPAPAVPAVTSFSGIESVQTDPMYGGQPVATHAQQSFTSLPAITNYASTPTDYASQGQGALVVAAPSGGYGGYGMAQNNNPYGSGTSQPTTNPYMSANPYAPTPPAPALTAPYQYKSPTTGAGNVYDAGSNPYGAPATTANPYAVPSQTNPYAAPAPSNPYLAPVPPGNPYGHAPSANPYGSAEPTDTKSAWTPPAPITTQLNPYDSTLPRQPYDTFNGGVVPPAVTPHAQQTPSSLGFGSPAPDFSGFTPAPEEKTVGGMGDTQPPSTPFGALTMNGLATLEEHAPKNDISQPTQQQPTSVVQSTFAKLASLDNFSVSSNTDAKRSNPFESPANASIGGNRSLGDIAKNKPKPTKEIMKTPVPAQQPPNTFSANPYGQQTSQHVMATSSGFGQPSTQPQSQPSQQSYGQYNQPAPQTYNQYQQQPQPYGQPAPTQTPAVFGQQNTAANMYGQQPTMQQQAPYGFNQNQPQPPTSSSQPTNQYSYGQAPAYPPQQYPPQQNFF